MGMSLYNSMIKAIREQRSNPTPAELLMYAKLRYRNIEFVYIHGVLSEHSFFTADFFIPKYRLIIEIDGKCHDNPDQAKRDIIKDIVYTSLGYNVLRIKNSEVDTFNTLTLRKYRYRQSMSCEDIYNDNTDTLYKHKRLKKKHENKKKFRQ